MIRRRKVSLFLMFTSAFLFIVLLLDCIKAIDMCDLLQVDLDKSEILLAFYLEGRDECLEVRIAFELHSTTNVESLYNNFLH